MCSPWQLTKTASRPLCLFPLWGIHLKSLRKHPFLWSVQVFSLFSVCTSALQPWNCVVSAIAGIWQASQELLWQSGLSKLLLSSPCTDISWWLKLKVCCRVKLFPLYFRPLLPFCSHVVWLYLRCGWKCALIGKVRIVGWRSWGLSAMSRGKHRAGPHLRASVALALFQHIHHFCPGAPGGQY